MRRTRAKEKKNTAASRAVPVSEARVRASRSHGLPCGPSQVASYAQGALANLRAYDPNAEDDPELEEKLRLRRLQDIVDRIRDKKAIDKMQFYGRRWVERWRATKVIQARMRGVAARKRDRIELAERQQAATALQAKYRGHRTKAQYQADREAEKRAQALAAARLQARVRGANTRGAQPAQEDDDDYIVITTSAPEEKAAPPPPAAVKDGPWVLVFGGAAKSRVDLAASLAAGSGGTLVDLPSAVDAN